MSRDTNITIISGRLTRDPEMRYTPAGKAVCTFALANSDQYLKDGVKHDKVNFFECQAWEKTAEIIQEYCKKGNKILVTGRTDQQRWDGDDGKKHTKNVINVNTFEFMGGKSDNKSDAEKTADAFSGDDPFTDQF